MDDMLHDVQTQLKDRQEDYRRQQRAKAKAEQESRERVRKAEQKVADVAGFRERAEEDAAKMLDESARARKGQADRVRSRLHEQNIQAREREIGQAAAGIGLTPAETREIAEKHVADAEKKVQEQRWAGAGRRLREHMPGLDEAIQGRAEQGLLQGLSVQDIRKMMLPELTKAVQREGGPGMGKEQALKEATDILDKAMAGLGQHLVDAGEHMQDAAQREQKQQQKPEILGIKEYAQKLQQNISEDNIPKKQLSVQERILEAIVKQRPDVVQQLGVAVFQ
jgi:hypothetical protein